MRDCRSREGIPALYDCNTVCASEIQKNTHRCLTGDALSRRRSDERGRQTNYTSALTKKLEKSRASPRAWICLT